LRLADILARLGDLDAAGRLRAEAEADRSRLEQQMQPVRKELPHTTCLGGDSGSLI
jgi:hypothetical protein